MRTETYRGVRLRVQRGREWGYLRWTVAGQPWGEHPGRDEEAALRSMRSYVDAAAERPDAYDPMWHPRERKPK